VHESTTYAPLVVNEQGTVLRRYTAVDSALHTGRPAWSPRLKRIARKRDVDTKQGPTSLIVVTGPRGTWSWRPPGQSIYVCGYYWLSANSLIAWTQPRTPGRYVPAEA